MKEVPRQGHVARGRPANQTQLVLRRSHVSGLETRQHPQGPGVGIDQRSTYWDDAVLRFEAQTHGGVVLWAQAAHVSAGATR